METIKSYQEQVYDIVNEYNNKKNNPQNILELHDFKERLDEIAFYVNEEYMNQCMLYANNKSEYTYNTVIKENELMKKNTINNKKVTSAYAKTLAEQENIELKRIYIKAEGIRDGLKQFLYQISSYSSDITQRIASLKKTY